MSWARYAWRVEEIETRFACYSYGAPPVLWLIKLGLPAVLSAVALAKAEVPTARRQVTRQSVAPSAPRDRVPLQ